MAAPPRLVRCLVATVALGLSIHLPGRVLREAFAATPVAVRSLHISTSGAIGQEMAPRGIALGAQRSRTARRAADTSALLDFTDKVVLVTGASRGIGAAIADKFAAAGATVIGTATSDSGAEAISARYTGDLKGEGMKLDVVSQDEVTALVKAVIAKYGGVDVLVNNAGITKDTLMLRMKEEAWTSVIDTNLNSIYRMSHAVLKGMTKKRFGRIISISSVVGSMGNAGQANYAAAKAGMEGFTRALAREVASRGITVNSVAPGFIDSDMTAVLKDEWKAKLLESVPVGRLGQPSEIADAVLFLAAPASGYITGQSLHVNGGMYM
uniref:3-oxoacyl-[acyl-carrier-protein] reductase n=1 Tax=Gambierdiscus belizeanus TaxID=439316 RepID=A0A1S6K860_9DINO|nr:trans3-ketoacyl acyl carrier protein reductase [Gambierdiscus belizeanus]